jgi:hypothetical protein
MTVVPGATCLASWQMPGRAQGNSWGNGKEMTQRRTLWSGWFPNRQEKLCSPHLCAWGDGSDEAWVCPQGLIPESSLRWKRLAMSINKCHMVFLGQGPAISQTTHTKQWFPKNSKCFQWWLPKFFDVKALYNLNHRWENVFKRLRTRTIPPVWLFYKATIISK